MRISVKNYKVVAELSEETECYTATIYMDGKRIGKASNRGSGGPDEYLFDSRELSDAFYEYAKEWAASDAVQNNPLYRYEFDGESRCSADAETLVQEACANFRRVRDAKKIIKKGYAGVVRLESQDGWQLLIREFHLPEGFDPAECIAAEASPEDAVFVYTPENGLENRSAWEVVA
jgi:hypothetical protein